MDYRFASAIVSGILFFIVTLGPANGQAIPVKDILFDDFNSQGLDESKWLIANSQWGGQGENGGVVPENIYAEPGKLVIHGNGDLYEGPVKGVKLIAGKPQPIGHGRRAGGCLVTKECFGSGRYEVRMKIPRQVGVCSALWTHHYLRVAKGHEEYTTNNGEGDFFISNHEIDIELPGRPSAKLNDIGYRWALLNTWVGERRQDMVARPTKLPFEVNDGEFHVWRFDWHTGDPAGATGKIIEPQVNFYLDGMLLETITDKVPVDAGRFWMGLWFPKKWAGAPNFETETLVIDWVRITPFNEPGDRHKYSRSGATPKLLSVNEWPARLRNRSSESSLADAPDSVQESED